MQLGRGAKPTNRLRRRSLKARGGQCAPAGPQHLRSGAAAAADMSTPTGSSGPRQLSDYLADEVFLTAFRDFLKGIHAAEALYFWADCEIFRR